MNKQIYSKGFTLLEALFSLSIIFIILLLIAPIPLRVIENQQEKQFLDTLESDLLLIQTLSLGSRDDRIKIVFHKNDYTVHRSRTQPLIMRPFPKGWEYLYGGFNTIFFTDGTTGRSGVIRIKTPTKIIRITFSPGKGRGYIEKEY